MHLFAICLGETRHAHSLRPKNTQMKNKYWIFVALFSLNSFFSPFEVLRQPFQCYAHIPNGGTKDVMKAEDSPMRKARRPVHEAWTTEVQRHRDARRQLQGCLDAPCCNLSILHVGLVLWHQWGNVGRAGARTPSAPRHEATLRPMQMPLEHSLSPALNVPHLPPLCSPRTLSFPLCCLSLSFTLLPQLVKITLEFCFSVKWIWTW